MVIEAINDCLNFIEGGVRVLIERLQTELMLYHETQQENLTREQMNWFCDKFGVERFCDFAGLNSSLYYTYSSCRLNTSRFVAIMRLVGDRDLQTYPRPP